MAGFGAAGDAPGIGQGGQESRTLTQGLGPFVQPGDAFPGQEHNIVEPTGQDGLYKGVHGGGLGGVQDGHQGARKCGGPHGFHDAHQPPKLPAFGQDDGTTDQGFGCCACCH